MKLFLTLVNNATIYAPMTQLSESLLLLLKPKNTLLLFLFVFSSFSGFSQKIKYDHQKFTKEIQKLQEEMIVDISKANETLRFLDNKYKGFHSAEINYRLTIKKIKFFSAYGDYARVKFEINKAKRFQFFFKVKKQDKLYLDLYSAVYESLGQNYDLLIERANKILLESDKSDKYLLLQCRLVLANSYSETGNFEQATHEIDEAKILVGKMSAPYSFQVANSAGQVYFFNNKVNKAIKEFQFAKELSRINKWKYAEQYANASLGEIYLYTNQLDLAKPYFDMVLKNEKSTELRDLFQVYGCLEHYYDLKKNMDSSYYYSIRRNEIDDLLENLRSENLVFELEKDFQTESNQYLLEEERGKNQQLRLILILILMSIVIIISVSYLFIRQKNDSNKVLQLQKEEIDEKNKEISNSLAMKESLLKEIHHRVKNNLQVISSILNLQSRNVHDPEALRIIEEGKERIRAIALIHNQLHLNNDSACVEMGAYLNKLISQMRESFSSYNKVIEVKVNVEEIDLAIDYAVPVGLIMCELLSNSYKHAFTKREKGLIEIELKNNPEKKLNYELLVKDNGVGYKGKIDFLEQSSTGVEIVSAFIQQLDAQYSYINDGGGFGLFIQFAIDERHSKLN
ncbi:histidine kinase dimerization/phosphoacceptor domain -containing protein [Fluviicola taffensis]|uniref:tetratricopeptide repeat-containing sensor histidine kinase n=1 Tax=Fluviicola taffensis TaxID=191579 RepID=UPI00313802BD